MISEACKMHVILYDTVECRAWLLDGASALLHLTCAQLHVEPYSSIDKTKFSYADPSNPSINAAQSALRNIANKELLIEEESTTRIEIRRSNGEEKREEIIETKLFCFKDLVRQTWNALEQIRDHQIKMLHAPEIGISFTTRDRLEGWGFTDIVERQFPARPLVTCVKPSGRGWADFSRGIGAVTLFGRGFGNLIEPSPDVHDICTHWKQVPPGQDYLAARIPSLQKICATQGDLHSNPLQIAKDIYWHKAHKLYEPCACKAGDACDPVQVLLPPLSTKKQHPDPFTVPTGAVIFRRSER
jgi:hypothetical protein